MKKAILWPILTVLTLNAEASIFDRIRDQLSKDIYTTFHGEGLPLKVGESSQGAEYRRKFQNEFGITSFIDELGLVQYKNNDIGIALLKKGNDDQAFGTILNQKNYSEQVEWRNGPQFLEALEDFTKDNGCVPKITSLSHGWASGDRPGEGAGLSGNKGFNGLYATNLDLPKSFAKAGARTLGKDLKKAIEKGDIKFCNVCVAQFYACNIAAKFAKTFAEVSGCQTVVATGQNSPNFQSTATEADKRRIYEGAHYWKSAAGVWAERHTPEQKARGERKASWYRATPLKNAQGEVIGISEENLGETYISL